MEDHLLTNIVSDSSASPNASKEADSSPEKEKELESKNQTTPAINSSETVNLDLQPKPSSAVIVWLLLIAAVLAVLGYEMHGDKHPAYNLAVSLTGDASDCEIFVDGKMLGKFTHGSKAGADNQTIWLQVDDGKHRVQLKKSGQTFQSRDVEVKGKEYLRFDSGSTSDPN